MLVAGEVILDRYIMGDVARVSPEAPIPILQVSRIEERPGNAGFVMANLRALGARVSALSVVGADRNGELLREMFGDLGIDTRSVLVDPDRPTIVKERMLGSVQSANRATQQLLRVDREAPHALSAARERALTRHLERELQHVDGVLISDINKGLLTPRLLRALIDGARRRRIPVIVDPRLSEDLSIYRGATALTPNRYETEFATGTRLVDRAAWMRAADELMGRLKLDACLVTLDRDGMYLTERRGTAHLHSDHAARGLRRDRRGRRSAGGVRPVRDRRAEFRLGGAAGESRRGNRSRPARHRDNLARGPRAGAQPGTRKRAAQDRIDRGIAPGARAPARRGPANRFHQWMLRPAARGAYRDALVCARAGRLCWSWESTATAACG